MSNENGAAVGVQSDDLEDLRNTPACSAVVDWLYQGEGCDVTARRVWEYLRDCIAYPSARRAAKRIRTDAQNLRAYFLTEICVRVAAKIGEQSNGVVNAQLKAREDDVSPEPKESHVLKKSATCLHIVLKHKGVTASHLALWSLDEKHMPLKPIATKNVILEDGKTTIQAEISELGESQAALIRLHCGGVELSAATRLVPHFTYESRLRYLGGVASNLVREEGRKHGFPDHDAIHTRLDGDEDNGLDPPDKGDPPDVSLMKREETRTQGLLLFQDKPDQYTPEARALFRFNPSEWPAIWTDFEIEVLYRNEILPQEIRKLIEKIHLLQTEIRVPAWVLDMIRLNGIDTLLLFLKYYSNLDWPILLQRYPGTKDEEELKRTVQEAVRNLPKRPAVTQPGYGHPGTILWRDYDGLSHQEISERLPRKKNGGTVAEGHARQLYVRAISACKWLAGKRGDRWPAAHSS